MNDELEWHQWKKKGDPVLHIELRKWADLFVICPLSANSLAKLSNGLCDNLLVCKYIFIILIFLLILKKDFLFFYKILLKKI